jgi:hypothetical protein
MNIWRNLHQFTPAAGQSRSQPIEVDGVFLGAAIEHELGVRFVAVDVRVTEMDQSIWPSVDYAYRSARQLFKSGGTAAPF